MSHKNNKEYLLTRYYKQRQGFIDFLGGECAVCGHKSNLQIDHIDPSTKKFTISRLWASGNLPEVYEELKKCQLLCASHHIVKTAKEHSVNFSQKGFRHGTMYSFMKKKCKCDECESKKRDFYESRNQSRRKTGSLKGKYGRPAECGTMLKYTRGCKCSECRKANSEYVKSKRKQASDPGLM